MSIAPTPSHGRKWLAMIRDTRTGWPPMSRCHRRHRCPPRLHRATIAATLTIVAVSTVSAVAPVLLVVPSDAADAVFP